MRTRLLLLILALAVLPTVARSGDPKPGVPVVPPRAEVDTEVAPKTLPSLRLKSLAEAPPVMVSEETAKALAKIEWKALKDGSLERISGGTPKGLIPMKYLAKAGLLWKEGALFFAQSPYKVDDALLAPMLKGLTSFTEAARTPAQEAGMKLAAWGLPPSVDGRRLYNPGGDATYYGQMMHYFLAAKPAQAAALGMQRTTQALDLIGHAYGQAFSKQAPDIAQTDLDRARLMLFAAPRTGETPLQPGGAKARPDPAAMLGDYKKQLQAEVEAAVKVGDEVRRKDSVQALAVLNNLEKQRFGKYQELPHDHPRLRRARRIHGLQPLHARRLLRPEPQPRGLTCYIRVRDQMCRCRAS